jgi:hypothetical protein
MKDKFNNTGLAGFYVIVLISARFIRFGGYEDRPCMSTNFCCDMPVP